MRSWRTNAVKCWKLLNYLSKTKRDLRDVGKIVDNNEEFSAVALIHLGRGFTHDDAVPYHNDGL